MFNISKQSEQQSQFLQVSELVSVSASQLQKAVESKLQDSLKQRVRSVRTLLGCALAEATAIYGFVIGLLIIIMLG